MLKVIKSISELDQEQLLSVYSGSNHNCKTEISFLSYLLEDFFQQEDASYFVWVVEDVYKSALRLEPYGDGLLLQALETEPSVRKMGYGSLLMHSVLEYLSVKRYRCVYAHVDKRNVASLKLHRKYGFQTVQDSAILLDGTVTSNCYTLCCYL